MDRRQKLHNLLKTVTGINNVYYQPPESVKIKYPCVIYSKKSKYTKRADNSVWGIVDRYEVTIVTNKADTDYADKILEHVQRSSYVRRFIANNLYHDTLSIYY